MMGRARTRARAGWPENLYPNRDGFKYRHPVTKRETYMGRDKAKAVAAAKKLNAMLAADADLVARVAGAAKKIGDALAIFRTDDVPRRNWGEKTAEWYAVYINRIETDLGERTLDGFTVKDCAEYIRGVTTSARSRQTYRLLLSWILACAVEEGWCETNVAEQTRKHANTRKRARLTVDVYREIHAAAPAWLQNAMDLSLLTLLRREDIVDAKFADVRDGFLWVMPQKTENNTGARLQIRVTDELAGVLARCRDDVVSPYLIHRLPERAKPRGQQAKGRVHATQVLPQQLTREFAEVRKAVGIEGKNLTSFHEIRSLGGALLRSQAGWTKEQVQELMAHSEVSTTEIYLDGHLQPWTPVTPALKLPG